MKLLPVVLILVYAHIWVGAEPQCPPVDGERPVFIPSPDCNKYYMCGNGIPYLITCPGNLHFNPTLNVCDWPDRAGCKEGEECLAD
ncbi:peritrophin-1-like [Tribolium madens]|uniref:peritrophin-1-like n=1 Tax=Tribolium madens TaxID=41895 RepID=UPI001CF72151|nr:peritrophin-1-like [Tribolium madens]